MNGADRAAAEEPSGSRIAAAGFGWLALFAALAIAAQRTVLAGAKASLLGDPDVRAKSVGAAAALRAVVSSLGTVELTVLAALGALVAFAVVAQIRNRAVGRFLAAALATRRQTFVLVALLAVAAQVWIFDTGPLLRHDGNAQSGVTALVAESFRDGGGTTWSFRWYGGYPLLAAYGCGFHVTAALASIALGSLEWGIKVVLLAGGIGTALAAAHLALRLGCRPAIAVVAGLAPLLSFQHTHTLAWGGKFPEALLYALFPLLLAQALELPRAKGIRGVAGFSLVGGAMALVHLPLGALGCVVAAVFAFASAVFDERPRPLAQTSLRLVASASIVLAIALPIALGVDEERGWILLGRSGLHSGGVADFGLPGAGSLADLLVWRNGWTGDVHAYLGLSLVLGGLGGAAFAASRRRAGAVPTLVAIAACVAMLGGGYIASRASEFLVTLLAIGLALGLETATALPADPSRRRLPLTAIACACLVADLGPTLVQAPGAANHAAAAAHLRTLRDEARGGSYLRLVRRGDSVGLNDTDNALDVPLDSPLGAHHYMGPNVWTAFTLALLNEARAAGGADDARAAAAYRGFAFQGVTVVGEDRRTEFGAPRTMPAGLVTTPARDCVRLAAGSPVTFADGVEIAPADVAETLARAPFSLYEKEWRAADTPVRAAARAAVARMGLDPSEPRAARLLVDAAAPPALLGQGPCRGAVVETETSAVLWRARIRVDSPGAVRLAVAWSPRTVVTVDGREPEVPATGDVCGGTVVALAAGSHDVEVRARTLNASSAWWSTAALVAVLVALRRRAPRRCQNGSSGRGLST